MHAWFDLEPLLLIHCHTSLIQSIQQGKYSFNGTTYQLPLNDYPRQNSLHGFLAGKKLSVYTTSVSANSGNITLSYDFDGSDEGYPFTLRMLVAYELSESGFKVSLTITNTMPQAPLPLTVGWHPYFACSTHQARVQFEPRTAWNLVELDTNLDPTGNTQLDTIFDGSQAIGGSAAEPTFYDSEFKPRSPLLNDVMVFKITDTTCNQSVVLWQDSSFRLTHIFTGAMKCFGEDGIALEPMSGMADAFNNHDHLTILSAGETWSGAFGVYVE